jgi:hypothetical protein
MPAVPSRAAKAKWLSLPLSRSTQATLFKFRILASDLASHISAQARSKENDFEESFCPICSRSYPEPADADKYESLHHMCSFCPQLSPEQQPLNQAASAKIAEIGGLLLEPASLPTQWGALPEPVQVALLLGNPVPALTFTIPDPQTRLQWQAEFLSTTTPLLRNLLHRRRDVISKLYSPT